MDQTSLINGIRIAPTIHVFLVQTIRPSSMMDEDIRRRSACDRCHSQKLRCPKRQGTDTCDRCMKSGASCVYSPFRQKKEPQGAGSSTDSHTPLSNVCPGKDNGNIKISTHQSGNKRKRITPLTREASQLPFITPN